ncbi:MAG: hypothetical protein ABJC89_23325 [Acidobacteriota bacterium]
METRQIVARAAGVIVVVGALFGAGTVTQANEQSGDHASTAQSRAIEGVWEPTVTARDCQTQAPLFSFLSMESYILGGSLVVENSSQPFERATGLGVWRHAGGRNFTSAFQFFTYAPDGTLSGRVKTSSHIRLSADGRSFRSSDTVEVSDLNGTVIFQGCATQEATRLK